MTSYNLETTSIPPLSKNKPKQVIVLCHGYGGDGQDISYLAGNWQRFFHITLPMVSPTTFFLLIIQMIGAFQLFAEPYVLTRGGPAQSSLSIVQYIYQNAFEYGLMGKAAAIAWLLFVVILFMTLLQFWLQRRWVHYES